MSAAFTLTILQMQTALLLFFQCIEYLKLSPLYSEKGIWRISIIKNDFTFLPRLFQNILNFLLAHKLFSIIIIFRLFLSIFLFFKLSLPVLLVLLFISFLISARFRGLFNGGSDYMTVVLLTGLAIAVVSIHWGLWYIALQSTISYVLAGVVKVKFKKWWNGQALIEFFNSPFYQVPKLMKIIVGSKTIAAFISISVLVFELSFPVALIYKPAVFIYVIIGLGFHFSIFLAYGLNRFLWAWTATYPALIYCCGNYWPS